MNFRTIKGETVENNMNALNAAIKEAGLNIDMIPSQKMAGANDGQIISLRHKQFGSDYSFKVASSTAGLVSSQGNVYDTVANGLDVAGEISRGSNRQGPDLNRQRQREYDGLAIRYTGDALPGQPSPPDIPPIMTPPMQLSEASLGDLDPVKAGTVTLAQNSLISRLARMQSRPFTGFRNMQTNTLGTGVSNDSGFVSLADIDVTDAEKAQDAMCVIDRALEEVSSTRGEIGAFQKNNLESNLNYLRIAHENVLSSESVIRDADMAEEMTNFTRNQIMTDSATAMLAQANARSQSVLRLFN